MTGVGVMISTRKSEYKYEPQPFFFPESHITKQLKLCGAGRGGEGKIEVIFCLWQSFIKFIPCSSSTIGFRCRSRAVISVFKNVLLSQLLKLKCKGIWMLWYQLQTLSYQNEPGGSQLIYKNANHSSKARFESLFSFLDFFLCLIWNIVIKYDFTSLSIQCSKKE